jgi:hypothetical protein
MTAPCHHSEAEVSLMFRPKQVITKVYDESSLLLPFASRLKSAERKFTRDASRMAQSGYTVQTTNVIGGTWYRPHVQITVVYVRQSAPVAPAPVAAAPAPVISPDGHYYWDGQAWRPMPTA